MSHHLVGVMRLQQRFHSGIAGRTSTEEVRYVYVPLPPISYLPRPRTRRRPRRLRRAA